MNDYIIVRKCPAASTVSKVRVESAKFGISFQWWDVSHYVPTVISVMSSQ